LHNWQQIDSLRRLAGDDVSINASHVGREGYGVYVPPGKSMRHRFVFLPDEGMAFFLELTKGKKPDALLFRRDHDRPWFGHYRAGFKNALRAANIPEQFTFHGLRHTYASQLIQSGAPLCVVSEQLGHVSIETVSRIYGHLAPQIRESEVRQRFATLSQRNRRRAFQQSNEFFDLRKKLHAGNWRTYAAIKSVKTHEDPA